MQEKPLKREKVGETGRTGNAEVVNDNLSSPEKREMLEHGQEKERIREVVETVESRDEEAGLYDEKARQASTTAQFQSKAATVTATSIATTPPIEEMIRQTVVAVKDELKKNEKEMKEMLKNRKTPYFVINTQAQKIRFLNNLLNQLKRAAKLAEEFIVGLWKQYVRKV
jgi:hypothetical protein